MEVNVHVVGTDLHKINGKTLLEGDITLSLSDLAEADKVQNTADNEKDVRSAGKFTNAIKINNIDFDGSADINIPLVDSNSLNKNEDLVIGAGKNLILSFANGKYKVSVNDNGALCTELVGEVTPTTPEQPTNPETPTEPEQPVGETFDNIKAKLVAVKSEVEAGANYEVKLVVENTDLVNFTANKDVTFDLSYNYPNGTTGFIIETPSVTVSLNNTVKSVEKLFTIARNSTKHGDVNNQVKEFTVKLAPTSITNATVDATPITLSLMLELEGDGFILD